jgi:two-component system, OmpR family, sensor histidine kinase SenX3
MYVPGRRGTIAFFVTFGVSLVGLAVALNVGWIVMTWSEVAPLVLGIFLFAAIITGLILNTTFLVREIRKNEQHDAFVNAVTHELKTPITSIRLHLETLRARGSAIGEDRRREFYDVMLEDSERLLQTVEQVLRTGKGARTPLSLERQDLRGLAQECVEFTRTRRHLGENLVRLAGNASPVEVLADREELRGAIVNLLDNAVKFSGDHIDVEVDVRRDGDRAVLQVRDQGPGLPAYEQKRIFRRFYRVPGPLTQRIKGTGLGLFIVQSAAKRHGGRAYAMSQGAGTGATFCIELPAAPAAG